MNKWKQVAVIFYVIVSISLVVAIVCFFPVKTNTIAITYLFSLDFPATIHISENAQAAFQFLKIFGFFIGLLSISQAVVGKKVELKEQALVSTIVILLFLLVVYLLKDRMVINLVFPLLLCLEGIWIRFMKT